MESEKNYQDKGTVLFQECAMLLSQLVRTLDKEEIEMYCDAIVVKTFDEDLVREMENSMVFDENACLVMEAITTKFKSIILQHILGDFQ